MDYLQLLKSATFEQLTVPKNFTVSPTENQVGVSVIPPCTADIRFQLGTFKLALPRFNVSKEELSSLPESWQNFIDSSNMKKINDKDKQKYELVTAPSNQGGCGSCFAVAIAEVISDNFLFGMDLRYNPSLSPMYILSCLKSPYNLQCAGGSPTLVIDDIINKGGIATNCCMNYEAICDSNMFCNVNGASHLDKNIRRTTENMNTMIPECGCCTIEQPKLYQIKNKTVSFDIPMIKKHLMKYGSAIGGFIVYKNFIKDVNKGKFLETKGIYVKSVNYSGNQEDIDEPAGGHAIGIVGWGVEKDLQIGTDVYPKVEYWICRNSWSTKWGNDGYFKYAMFQEYPNNNLPPINKNIAFETNNIMLGQGNLGGIILIEPAGIESTDTLSKVNCNANYTCLEQNPNEIIEDIVVTLLSNKGITILLSLCILSLFGILFYSFFKKDKKRHK